MFNNSSSATVTNCSFSGNIGTDPLFCFGDIVGDCKVGIVDFLLLLANWG